MSQIYECYPDLFRLRYSESAYEMKLEKNDREGGRREGEGRGPTLPWALSSFQGERVGCTFLVCWSFRLRIGTQRCPWASETYIALKEATGNYSTQTKFNGLIVSG